MNALLIAFLAVQSIANPAPLGDGNDLPNYTANAMLAAGCETTVFFGTSDDRVSVTCNDVAETVYTNFDAAQEDAEDACDGQDADVQQFGAVYVAVCLGH